MEIRSGRTPTRALRLLRTVRMLPATSVITLASCAVASPVAVAVVPDWVLESACKVLAALFRSPVTLVTIRLSCCAVLTVALPAMPLRVLGTAPGARSAPPAGAPPGARGVVMAGPEGNRALTAATAPGMADGTVRSSSASSARGGGWAAGLLRGQEARSLRLPGTGNGRWMFM